MDLEVFKEARYINQHLVSMCYEREAILSLLEIPSKEKIKEAIGSFILNELLTRAVNIDESWQTQGLEFVGVLDSRGAVKDLLSKAGCMWNHPFNEGEYPKEYLEDLDDEDQGHQFLGECETMRWGVDGPNGGSSAHAFWACEKRSLCYSKYRHKTVKTWSWITSSDHNVSVIEILPRGHIHTVFAVFYDNTGSTFCPGFLNCFVSTRERYPLKETSLVIEQDLFNDYKKEVLEAKETVEIYVLKEPYVNINIHCDFCSQETSVCFLRENYDGYVRLLKKSSQIICDDCRQKIKEKISFAENEWHKRFRKTIEKVYESWAEKTTEMAFDFAKVHGWSVELPPRTLEELNSNRYYAYCVTKECPWRLGFFETKMNSYGGYNRIVHTPIIIVSKAIIKKMRHKDDWLSGGHAIPLGNDESVIINNEASCLQLPPGFDMDVMIKKEALDLYKNDEYFDIIALMSDIISHLS